VYRTGLKGKLTTEFICSVYVAQKRLPVCSGRLLVFLRLSKHQ